jgi:hypothetical protein
VKDKIASFRDTVGIEQFFAAAYRRANRQEALINILFCEASRAHFIMFLKNDFYADRVDELTVPRSSLSSSTRHFNFAFLGGHQLHQA